MQNVKESSMDQEDDGELFLSSNAHNVVRVKPQTQFSRTVEDGGKFGSLLLALLIGIISYSVVFQFVSLSLVLHSLTAFLYSYFASHQFQPARWQFLRFIIWNCGFTICHFQVLFLDITGRVNQNYLSSRFKLAPLFFSIFYIHLFCLFANLPCAVSNPPYYFGLPFHSNSL